MMATLAFTSARVCHDGAILAPQSVFVDTTTGLIVASPQTADVKTVDIQNRVLAPAFLELQTNGCVGVHFTNYTDDDEYLQNLEKVSRWMVKRGVGGWWATVPTVDKDLYKKASRTPSCQTCFAFLFIAQ